MLWLLCSLCVLLCGEISFFVSLAPVCFDMSAMLSDRLVNFRQVLAAPRTDLLAYGAEPACGPGRDRGLRGSGGARGLHVL